MNYVGIEYFLYLGSRNTAGEFFNPGLNCSDILDKREDAKDGFYWINLKRSNLVKVGPNSAFNFMFEQGTSPMR